MNTAHYIDIHILQTLPYSNINRDDLGSPKQLIYGGTERTRISSQCWKRVTRHEVERMVGQPTARTRRVPEQVSKRLQARGWPKELADKGGEQVLLSARKDGIAADDSGTSSVLLYLPMNALDQLADLVEQHRDAVEQQAGAQKLERALPTEEVAHILRTCNGTIHLFGRMLAELPGGTVDGAAQVAHAFTTHAAETEVDFWAAVDDLLPPDQTGSGNMNNAEFSAGVFYRYANVDVSGLQEAVGDKAMAHELTRAFLEAFTRTMPTGKQRSTAAQTLPDLIHVAARSDRPVSLAAAFEAPVRASDVGWGEPSRKRLSSYATSLARMWGDASLWSGHVSIDDHELTGLGAKVGDVDDLFGTVTQAVTTDTD